MADQPNPTPEKDTSDWVTGDEPMTGPQSSYLQTLSQQAGEPFDESLTKAQASERIEELQSKTGRGGGGSDGPTQGQESLPADGGGAADPIIEGDPGPEAGTVTGSAPQEGVEGATDEE